MSLLDKDLLRQAYIAKTAPSDHEIGWLGHTNDRFSGTDKNVQVEFDPTDPDIRDKFIYHTHPAKEPSPLTALPSEQDLISAVMATEEGLQGITVFSGKYYTIAVPTSTVKKSHFGNYLDAVSRGDIEDAVKELERSGFDVETGTL